MGGAGGGTAASLEAQRPDVCSGNQDVAGEEGGAFSQRMVVPLGRVSKHCCPHTPVCPTIKDKRIEAQITENGSSYLSGL